MTDCDNVECKRAIAALIKGTKSRKRPFSLVILCDYLKEAIECYGSVSAVAERISLSESMLKRFLTIDKLSSEMRLLVESREIDSIDSVAEISGLDENRQNELGKCFAVSKLSTEDVRNFVRISRKFSYMTTEDILRIVEDARTQKVYSYEFVRRRNQTEGYLRERFLSILSPNNILNIKLGNALGKLTVTSEGRSEIELAAKSSHTSADKLIQRCINNSIL